MGHVLDESFVCFLEKARMVQNILFLLENYCVDYLPMSPKLFNEYYSKTDESEISLEANKHIF